MSRGTISKCRNVTKYKLYNPVLTLEGGIADGEITGIQISSQATTLQVRSEPSFPIPMRISIVPGAIRTLQGATSSFTRWLTAIHVGAKIIIIVILHLDWWEHVCRLCLWGRRLLRDRIGRTSGHGRCLALLGVWRTG